MMKLSFRNISIKYKIIVIIITVTLLSQLIAVYIYTKYDKNDFNENALKNLKMLSQVISKNSTAALLFNDSIQATNILHSLKADPHIKLACIYNNKKSAFAIYRRERHNQSFPKSILEIKDTVSLTSTSINILKPIYDEIDQNDIIGYIFLDRDLKDYDLRLSNILQVLFIITLASLLFALLISTQMQKIISNPIRGLSEMVNKITKNRDFSLRIQKKGNDELGELIGGFNDLLSNIEKQNEDLTHAKEQAISSAQIKEQFLANMSHEIRTPMNAIVGMTSLLIDTPVNEEQSEYLRHIKSSADNLLVIINDVLDFSKIEAGKIEFESIPFSINDSFENIRRTFNFKLKDKNLCLNIKRINDFPDYFIGDQVRLNQILLNLIGNAFKFTEKGSITLKVEKLEESAENIILQFKVQDTGIGIPKDKLDHIFLSFNQATSETNRKYGGTGLGLTISKQLVELQNGKIWVESEIGKGSIFYFTIPFKKAVPPNFNHYQNIKANESIEISLALIENASILIVEDNQLNLLLATTILKKQKFRNIHTAENGQTAVEMIKKFDYNVILMDLHMPVMDGYEATRFIRENMIEKKRTIPIIALTAAAIKGEKEKCIEAGMNEYISKPFNANELFEKIYKFL